VYRRLNNTDSAEMQTHIHTLIYHNTTPLRTKTRPLHAHFLSLFLSLSLSFSCSLILTYTHSHSPSGRIDSVLDANASVVVTANEGVRGGRHIPLKQTIDEALRGTNVETVFVYQRTDRYTPWVEGRDVDLTVGMRCCGQLL
jgi:hypothetical protein